MTDPLLLAAAVHTVAPYLIKRLTKRWMDESVRTRHRLKQKKEIYEYRKRLEDYKHENRKQLALFNHDLQVSLRKLEHDNRVNFEIFRTEIELNADEIRRARQQLAKLNELHESVCPFRMNPDYVREHLYARFTTHRKPIVLVAPFWHEAKPDAENAGGGGMHFRTAITKTWHTSHGWSSDLDVVDGWFKRPLMQTDMDVDMIHEILPDLPIIVAYGSLDDSSVSPMFATWNVLPGREPSDPLSLPAVELRPPDNAPLTSDDFRKALGFAVSQELGQVGSIYQLFQSGRPVNLDLFLTDDQDADSRIFDFFNGYYELLHDLDPATYVRVRSNWLEQAEHAGQHAALPPAPDTSDSTNRPLNQQLQKDDHFQRMAYKASRYFS